MTGKNIQRTWIFIHQYGYCTQVQNSVPVITRPRYMENNLKKIKRKQELKQLKNIHKKSQLGSLNIPIITSPKKQLNFYFGQTYDKFANIPLVSQGWIRNASSGQMFTINSWKKNPSLPVSDDDDYEEINSFDRNTEEPKKAKGFSKFPFDERVLDGIENLGFKSPTPIQKLTIPKILEHKNVICSAETGSGKTVAYIAPVINNLLINKCKYSTFPSYSPRAVVLVPGRELAEQIGEVASKLGQCAGISVEVLVGGRGLRKSVIYSDYDHSVDLVVSTFGVMEKLVRKKVFSMSCVQHLILDEADTMLDDSFNMELKSFLQKIVFQEKSPEQGEEPNGAQLVLVGATFPTNIDEVLNKVTDVENLEKIKTYHLHRVLPHVPQKFFRIKGPDRAGKLLELVKNDMKKEKPTMIFTNQSPACTWLNRFLLENNVPNELLHGDMPLKLRVGRFEAFQRGEFNILSCTDLGSRGLDTQRVQHVINFDFPNHMSDYIHRVGRTGRVGSAGGHVTNFISNANAASITQKIELAVRKSFSLSSVNANIKRKLNEMYGEVIDPDEISASTDDDYKEYYKGIPPSWM